MAVVMISTVPDGHPGDSSWRLPVWRTLLRLQLVDPAQLEPANALVKQGGFFVSHLVTLGVNPDKLLTAIAIATGLPSAARHEVRRPKPQLAEGLDPELLRSLLASPFKREGPVLHLAFVVPVAKEKLLALPPHKAHVALETDIRDGLEVLFPRRRTSGKNLPKFDPSLAEFGSPPPSAPPISQPQSAWGRLRTKLGGMFK
jgi:hypothetical protein